MYTSHAHSSILSLRTGLFVHSVIWNQKAALYIHALWKSSPEGEKTMHKFGGKYVIFLYIAFFDVYICKLRQELL